MSELYHHGVKGMKWGVRRYQNEDGTLTAAGRKRYGSGELGEARLAKAKAKKEYDKAFNKAYNRAAAAYSPFKKHRAANDKRWEDASTKYDAYKEAKKNLRSAEKRAVAAYRKHKEEAEEHAALIDTKWNEVNAEGLKVGKNVVSRMLLIGKTMAGKSDAAKTYLDKWDEAEEFEDLADTKWNEVRSEYEALGRNAVERLFVAARHYGK